MDWRLLTGAEARQIDPERLSWPDGAEVVYGLVDSLPVARAALVNLPLIEGTWVAPSKRGGRLAIRLMSKVEAVLADKGYPYAVAMQADSDPTIAKYLEFLGYERIPVSLYKKQLTKEVK